MIDCKDCRHHQSGAYCMRHSAPDYVEPMSREVQGYDMTIDTPYVGVHEFIGAYGMGPRCGSPQYATSCEAERHGPSTDRHCGEDARFFEPKQQETT